MLNPQQVTMLRITRASNNQPLVRGLASRRNDLYQSAAVWLMDRISTPTRMSEVGKMSNLVLSSRAADQEDLAKMFSRKKCRGCVRSAGKCSVASRNTCNCISSISSWNSSALTAAGSLHGKTTLPITVAFIVMIVDIYVLSVEVGFGLLAISKIICACTRTSAGSSATSVRNVSGK